MKNQTLKKARMILLGSIAGIVVILAVAMLMGVLMVRGVFPEKFEAISASVATVLGATTGTIIAIKGEKKVVSTAASAVLMLAMMLMIHAIIFGNESCSYMKAPALVLCTSIIICMLAMRNTGKPAKHYRRFS